MRFPFARAFRSSQGLPDYPAIDTPKLARPPANDTGHTPFAGIIRAPAL
jgi:hypothetical protein